jgi:hypothetical protein
MSKMSELSLALDEYADYLKADYNSRTASSPYKGQFTRELVVEFDMGNKFIKVIVGHSTNGVPDTGRSSHSFIVLGEYKGAKNIFKHGDILKSASWRAPAKNFARGNIMENSYGSISWAGA